MLSPCSEALSHLLPPQAHHPSSPDSSRSPDAAVPFPQRVWITPRRTHARLRRDNRGGVPGERPGAAIGSPASCWRRTVANGPGSRSSCRYGTPVCAAARGPVCAAADTAPRLDSPLARLGCQATFRPPVGAATRSNGCCALPCRSAPRRGTREAPAPLRSARAAASCHPHTPSRGALRLAGAPGGSSMSLLLAGLCAAGHRGRTRAPVP